MAITTISADLAQRIHDFVRQGIDINAPRPVAASSPFWAGLAATGSELWLDTGDIKAAEALWCKEFTALTTNNTLLNKEIQTGFYDSLIADAAKILGGLDTQTKILEIAFILNARHGLRLVQRFGGKVSVELHTDLADEIDAAVAYGKRYYAICPTNFIVKVPLTASGLITTRRLREAGIPVNFTLGFSARHNHFAAAIARPTYVNVFLGRLGAYVKDNKLGTGDLVGEKALLASQREVAAFNDKRGKTLQIAASLRGASQIRDLAGCDVYTMPTTVAAAALKELDGKFVSKRGEDYPVSFAPTAANARTETLWTVTPAERALAADLAANTPNTAAELVAKCQAAGIPDLFPVLSDADRKRISADGKIPKHEAWAERIAKGELAIDTMLNLAGLASFVVDEAALDDRIKKNM